MILQEKFYLHEGVFCGDKHAMTSEKPTNNAVAIPTEKAEDFSN